MGCLDRWCCINRSPSSFHSPPTAVYRFTYFSLHYITTDWPACCRLCSSSLVRSLSLCFSPFGAFFCITQKCFSLSFFLSSSSLARVSDASYLCGCRVCDVRRRKNDRACGVGQSMENYQIRRSTGEKEKRVQKEATAIAGDLSMCAWVCAWTSVQTSRQTALLTYLVVIAIVRGRANGRGRERERRNY